MQKKVAIITGAASGIGYLTAERFALNGMRVALMDVNPNTVEAAAEWK
jgi:NAD(P)-dependent dehydrogenase (short-subunit alcohol dehydrogenase family)